VQEGIKPLWVFTCEGEIRSSPAVYRGLVYVGTHDNNSGSAIPLTDGFSPRCLKTLFRVFHQTKITSFSPNHLTAGSAISQYFTTTELL
jgi:hypothetical protein